MAHHFKKHYTRDEARGLLPLIRQWLEEMTRLRGELNKCDQRLGPMLESGAAVGGSLVNTWVRTLADLRDVAVEFQRREILIKDIERGLVDFPAIIGGKEVFLCWESGEEDVEFWHDLDTGYAGRERL